MNIWIGYTDIESIYIKKICAKDDFNRGIKQRPLAKSGVI